MSTRHKWGDKVRADDGSQSRKVCERCDMICVSRHEHEGGRDRHWKEFFRGTVRVECDKTPACEPVEVDA
jgi:hypothetical protein